MAERRVQMNTWQIVLLVILVITIIAFVALLIYGRKLQKKSEASQAEIRAGAQTYSKIYEGS